jgi:hypothetical protein
MIAGVAGTISRSSRCTSKPLICGIQTSIIASAAKLFLACSRNNRGSFNGVIPSLRFLIPFGHQATSKMVIPRFGRVGQFSRVIMQPKAIFRVRLIRTRAGHDPNSILPDSPIMSRHTDEPEILLCSNHPPAPEPHHCFLLSARLGRIGCHVEGSAA